MPSKEGFFPAGINTGAMPPYTPAIAVGDQVYVSGQGPLDLATLKIVGTTIEEQTELTLQNVKRVLESAGCTMGDCVKVTVYLADIADFDRYNVIYRKHFPEPRPARTTVQAKLWGGILVEIDALAIRNCGSKK